MTGFKGLISSFGGLINYSITLLVGIALLVFFWGLARFIFQSGSTDHREEGRNIMIWGILSLFVMVSIWGIVFFFQRSFGLVPPNDIVDPGDVPDLPDDSPFKFQDDSTDRNV